MNNMTTPAVAFLAALSLTAAPAAPATDKADDNVLSSLPAKETRLERELAAAAVKAAAEEAVRSALEEIRLDLDIRLIGPTSPKIAGRK